MPGVNAPSNEQFFQFLGQLQQRARAMETQQQSVITNAIGQPIVNLGLVPGSDPARYGLQFLDAATGAEIAFLGESSTGSTLSLMLTSGGSIEIDNGGSMTMKSATGQTVLFAGTASIPDGSGRVQQVFELLRDDGTPALELADLGTVLNHAHQQALQWIDRAGNIVLADDTTSGIGLARPHLAVTLKDTNTSTWPATTATTWTSIASGYIERQCPRLNWVFTLFSPASTTGQFRLLVGGTQVGTTQTVGT